MNIGILTDQNLLDAEDFNYSSSNNFTRERSYFTAKNPTRTEKKKQVRKAHRKLELFEIKM